MQHADYDKMIQYYMDNCGLVKPHGLYLKGKTIMETSTEAAQVDPITFYLCGAIRMVRDTSRALNDKGVF